MQDAQHGVAACSDQAAASGRHHPCRRVSQACFLSDTSPQIILHIAYQEVYNLSLTVALKPLSVASLIPQRKAQRDKLHVDSDVAPITAMQTSVARFWPVFISRKYPNSVRYADFILTLLLPCTVGKRRGCGQRSKMQRRACWQGRGESNDAAAAAVTAVLVVAGQTVTRTLMSAAPGGYQLAAAVMSANRCYAPLR